MKSNNNFKDLKFYFFTFFNILFSIAFTYLLYYQIDILIFKFFPSILGVIIQCYLIWGEEFD